VRFNGSDYIHPIDSPRLSAQHLRIKTLMLDHSWRTLKEISYVTNDPEASISAQLRHLRKQRFGSFVIEKKSRGDRENGLYEYRVMPPGYCSEFIIKERVSKQKQALTAVWNHEDCTDSIKKTIRDVFKKCQITKTE